MNKKVINKKTAGISLVALVVTIIVLIILTGAVVATFMEDGIIDKAKEAVKLNNYTTLKEAYVLRYNAAKIEEATGTGEVVDKAKILEETVNELGLEGFSFVDTDVLYGGENDIIDEWIKVEFELEELSKLGYIFTTINGVTYMTGITGDENAPDMEEDFYAKVAEIEELGFTVEDGELGGIDTHVQEGYIATSDKIMKDGEVLAIVLIKGDVDGGCLVDGSDVAIFVSIKDSGMTTGTEIEKLAADMNNDGYVDDKDTDLILDAISIEGTNKYQRVTLTPIKQ